MFLSSVEEAPINCIIFSNISLLRIEQNWFKLTSFLDFTNSCTTPLSPGVSNITADPQLLDGIHLAVTSPCRGSGNPAYASSLDIDGEPWTNPPSMGCDEVWEAGLTGPLSVAAASAWPTVAAWGNLPLTGTVSGRAARVAWDFGDGSVLTNASYVNTSHIWTSPGDYLVTFTAYNVDNPSGVSTNLGVHVAPLVAPVISPNGLVGTNFNLSFPGQPGITYIVEQSSNLLPPIACRP